MPYRVTRSREAAEEYRTLPPDPKKRVKAALAELAEYPYGPAVLQMNWDVERYRVRVGDYRIIFEPGPDSGQITILRIRERETAYEGMEHPGFSDD